MEVKHFKGLKDFIYFNQIKELRKIYKYFPYLYKYNLQEEEDYFKSYLVMSANVDIFYVEENGEILGASLGCPVSKSFGLTKPLFDMDINMDKTYYFADIMIKKDHWGKGIAFDLYQKHIDYVKENNYEKICALIVNRDNDPRKPESFKKSNIWQVNKFEKTDKNVVYPWSTYQEDGSVKQEINQLDLYIKNLR